MHPRVAFVVFVFLAMLHTWPLASSPGQLSLNHNADTQQGAWTLAWIARTLPTDPLNLFNGNIFAPEPNTLAYSEPMIVPAIAVMPLLWLGASPVLAYNVGLMLGLALTGFAAWLGARHWTGSDAAALVAGALAAFNPHLLTRLPHIMAAWAWTIPLSLYLADRMIDDRRRRTGALLALTVLATAANSIYWLALVGIVVGLVMLVATWERRWMAAARIASAALAGIVVALPILLPYLAFASTGARRPIEQVAQFSATLPGYLHSASRLHAGWSAPFFEKDVSVFFAGFTALLLAGIGLIGWRGHEHRRRRLLLVAVGITGVLLSLGPATAFYRLLYDWALPLQGLRAAARFGYLYLVAVAFAAALGTAWLSRLVKASPQAVVVAGAALLLVTAESWSAPILTQPFTGVPTIYARLRDLPDPVMLAEMPFWPPDAVFENGEYMLNATAHWRPVMNGTSGFTPLSYRRRAPFFWYFPEARALDRLKPEGVTHVMVHLERWAPHERPDLERALRAQTALTLIATDSQGHRLYRVN